MKILISSRRKRIKYFSLILFALFKGIIVIFFLFGFKLSHAQIIIQDTVQAGITYQINQNLSGISQYYWDFGDGTSSTMASPNHLFTNTNCGFSTIQIQLQVTDTANNSYQFSKQVVVKNLPPNPSLVDIDMITPFSNCDNSPSLSNPNFTIILNNTTNDTNLVSYYLANWGDNSVIDTLYNTSFPISHLYQNLGLFNLEFTAVSYQGCSTLTSYTIANQSNPAVGLSSLGSTQGCAPQEFIFILSQFQNNSPGTYYVWDFGDGSPNTIWTYNDPYITDSIKHVFQSTSCQNGGLAFTVSVTAHNYCDQTTATVSNIRIYTSPTASFNTSADTSCLGTSISFGNNTLSGFGYNCNGNANYLWDFGDGTTSYQTNGQHSYSTTGTYTVKLLASNGVCGVSTDSTQIVINEFPNASAIVSTTTACDSVIAVVNNLSTGGNLKYQWQILPSTGWHLLNGTSLTDENPVIKFDQIKTYTLKLITSNNCGSDDTTINIKVQGKPTVHINTIPNICGSGSIIPTAQVNSHYSSIISTIWTFSGGTPSISTANSSSSISYNSPGNYQVKLSKTNGCGSQSDSISFIVYQLPTVQATINTPAICYGNTANLIASGATNYTWTDGNNSISTNSTVIVNPQITTTYYLTGTDSNQCSNTDSVSLLVNALPPVTISSNKTSLCFGDTLSLLGSGALNYSWMQGQSIIGNSSSFTSQPTNSSTLKLIGEDINGCISEDSMYIQVFNQPVLSINPINPSICEGDSVQITVGGAQNILIQPFGVLTGNTFNLKPISTTQYTVSGYDLAGCQTDSVFSINVNPLPSISITLSKSSACSGDSILFSAQGGNSYQWTNNSAQIISTNSNFNHAPSGSGSVYVKVFDNNGCVNNDSVSFTIHNLPTIQTSQSANNLCYGDSIWLNAFGANSYKWYKNGTQISSTSVFNDTIKQNSSFLVVGTDVNGCSNTAATTVNVHAKPHIQVSANGTYICLGDSMQLNLSGGISYTLNGVNFNSGNYLNPTNDTYYQIIGSDINNCLDTTDFMLNVKNLPIITASASISAICLGQSTQLTAIGGTSYFWTPSQGLNSNNLAQVSATPSQSTSYIVKGTDNFGCSSIDTISIFVSSNLQIQASASSQNICLGDTVALTATGASTYQWNTGNGLLASTGSTTQAVPNSSGTYIVTGTDSLGCISTNSVSVNVYQLPNIQITTSANSVCPGDSLLVQGIGGINYFWEISDTSQYVLNTIGSSFYYSPSSNTQFKVIGFDNHQCKNTQTATAALNPKPTVVASTNKTTICIGETVQLSASGAQSYHWFGNVSIPYGNTTSTLPNTSGWYKVQGISSLGCSNNDSVFVNVNNLPSISTLTPNPSICSGDSTTISIVGIGTLNWMPILGLSNSNSNTVKASPLISTNYNVQITDSNGCENQINIPVTVNALPVASFSFDSLVCKNSTINFINQSTNTTQYNWDFGDNTNSTSQNAVHSYNQTGYFNVSLAAISSQNCLDTIERVIHVIEAPQANFTTYPQIGCAPLNINLNNTTSAYGSSYFWSINNGQSSTAVNPAGIIFNSPDGHDTTYIIQLTATNICGVSAQSDTVIVNTKPVANFGFNLSSQCSPATATFGNISSSNSGSYNWNLGDNSYCSQTTPANHNYTANNFPVDYHIQLTAINSCGSDTMQKVLHLNPNYVHSIFTPSQTQACAPAVINFSNYSNVQTSASWNFDDGNVSSQINPTHIYNTPGTYNVSLIVTDNCGIDTTVIAITVGNPPTINFTLSADTVCQFETFSMQNLTSNLTNLQWNFGDSSTSNMNNVVHQYTGFGQYPISLIGEDILTHCTDTADAIVVVQPTAIASISTNNPDGCYPLNVNFQNNTQGATYYSWDFSDGNSSVSQTPSHIFNNPGTYNVKLIATNYYGCADTTYTIIKAYPRPVAGFTVNNLTPCQFPTTIEFINHSTGASGYYWDFNNLDSSKFTNPTYQYANSGNYSPKLIAYNAYQCTDTATININLTPVPIADFSTDISELCEDSKVQFFNKSTNAQSFEWYFGDGDFSTLNNPSEIYSKAGNYFPYLIAHNTDGCTDTLIMTDKIIVNPNPVADFNWTFTDAGNKEHGLVLFQNQSILADNFSWNFGDNSTSTDINPEHQFQNGGEYTVTLYAINNYGCDNTLTKSLSVNMLKGLFIPTALAPNHPNSDVQKFTPVGKELQSYHLAIYDSWGNLLWETTELQDGEPVESWSGNTKDGTPLQQGVYFWACEAVFKDGTIWKGMTLPKGDTVRKGTVTLIR